MERCETFHDYYLIEFYTPFALTVTLVVLLYHIILIQSTDTYHDTGDIPLVGKKSLSGNVPRVVIFTLRVIIERIPYCGLTHYAARAQAICLRPCVCVFSALLL